MADVPPIFRSRRVRRVLIAASVLGLIIGLDTLVLHLRLDPLADVRAYYDAGARLNAGLPLYVQTATTDDPGFYRYPPLLAIAFRPLALLPYETAALIWEAFLIVLFVGTLVRLGLRNQWTWIVSGWLAAPIAWSLAVGQAQVAVTFLVALGAPWAIALAGNLKILPVIVAIYWIGRRDWRAIRRFVAWLVGLSRPSSSSSRPARSRSSGSPTWPRSGTSRTGRCMRSRRCCGACSSSAAGAGASLRADAGRLGAGGLGVRAGQPAAPDVPAVDAPGRGPATRRRPRSRRHASRRRRRREPRSQPLTQVARQRGARVPRAAQVGEDGNHQQRQVLRAVQKSACARESRTVSIQAGIIGRSGRVRITSRPAVSHQPLVLIPMSANGRIDGLSRMRAPGHFHRRAAATRAVTTMTGAPRK